VRTLYRVGRVHTFGHPPTGEWILVDGRHIQRVGSGEPPAADRTVELPGATVLPGFIDSHVHLTSTGLALANADVMAARSARELLEIARTRAPANEGVPVLLQGYDETRWEVRDLLPTLDELDAAVPGPLVIRRIDGHTALANRAALAAAEIADAPGVERDASGEPTGVVTRQANSLLGGWTAAARSDLQIERLQLAAASLGTARGVTAVHEMSMPHDDGERDVEVFRRHRARLPVHAIAIVATMDVPRAIELGHDAIGGDLPTDGSIGARTAAVTIPFIGSDDRGTTYYADDELAGFFHDAHMAGLQAGVHAIGDRAIEQVLSAWERIYASLDSRQRRHFRARRHRVEHFEMPTSDQVERAAMLGLAVSVQPAFDRAWGSPGGMYESRVGPERAAAMNPFRTMLDRGVMLGAGSDAPVTELDPWLAVHAMERHHDATQRLGRVEAIRVHTAGSARLAHQEEKKGLLEAGYHADFAAYDADPLTLETVEGLRPILTVSLGRDVFAS
jgi:predicted amidohydrolase YtcJ